MHVYYLVFVTPRIIEMSAVMRTRGKQPDAQLFFSSIREKQRSSVTHKHTGKVAVTNSRGGGSSRL